MNLHDRTLLAYAESRTSRLLAEADVARALRARPDRGRLRGVRRAAAAALRGLAARLEPKSRGRLA